MSVHNIICKQKPFVLAWINDIMVDSSLIMKNAKLSDNQSDNKAEKHSCWEIKFKSFVDRFEIYQFDNFLVLSVKVDEITLS